MSRNKALAMLQKTYDDSYLSCSTAVYHESQGNETEAMRHWRGALDQIYEHNATKVPSTYAPRTDTEKALMDALKQLELQCKERIDLLEALRVSRQDSPSVPPSVPSTGKLSKAPEPQDSNFRQRGSIGQGTIPAVSYSDLSRPSLPHRPSMPTRPSSDEPVTPRSGSNSIGHHPRSRPNLPSAATPKLSSPASPAEPNNSARSQSPDKHTMRTTLRSGKSGDKPSKSSRKSSRPAGEGPSKAATLAWSALTSRDKAVRSSSTTPSDRPSVPAATGQRRSSEHPRKPTSPQLQWDSHTRRLVQPPDPDTIHNGSGDTTLRHSDECPRPSYLSISAASSALTSSSQDPLPSNNSSSTGLGHRSWGHRARGPPPPVPRKPSQDRLQNNVPTVDEDLGGSRVTQSPEKAIRRKQIPNPSVRSSTKTTVRSTTRPRPREQPTAAQEIAPSSSDDDRGATASRPLQQARGTRDERMGDRFNTSDELTEEEVYDEDAAWKKKKESILKKLPPGVDESAAKQILNDIVVQGDEVRWSDIAGLEVAKNALREAVVYPFLRPDLFMGLREPARGMLLFGPPGTGKTMLARAVATESRSTFFSISASSLTSKFLGESEKLVRALFGLAKVLAPSIIFVDEIDSLLSQRSGSGEHEATRRIKTEFLIQWSDLQRAAAGRESTDRDRDRGDANRVLVLAATNLPWAIDEAARRRFVRRQYIPLPEASTRETQLRTLLGQQKHGLSSEDISELVRLTEGFSGSDITALAKDAAMGPLRSVGDALLHMTMDDIRPITLLDFKTSLGSIRPSVSQAGLKEYEDWAREFGERGGQVNEE